MKRRSSIETVYGIAKRKETHYSAKQEERR